MLENIATTEPQYHRTTTVPQHNNGTTSGSMSFGACLTGYTVIIKEVVMRSDITLEALDTKEAGSMSFGTCLSGYTGLSP